MVTKFLYMTSAFLIGFSTQGMTSSDVPDVTSEPSKKLNLSKVEDTNDGSHVSKKPLSGVVKLTKNVLGKGHDILDKGVDGAAKLTVNHLLTEKAKERVLSGKSEKRLHNLTKIEKRATQGAQVILAGGAVGTLLLGQPELAGILGIGAGAAGALTITSNAQESLGNKWLKKLQKALDSGDHESAGAMIIAAQESNLITIQPVEEEIFPSLVDIKETLSNVIETVSPIFEKVEDRLPEGGPLATVFEKVSPVLQTMEDLVEKKDTSET